MQNKEIVAQRKLINSGKRASKTPETVSQDFDNWMPKHVAKGGGLEY